MGMTDKMRIDPNELARYEAAAEEILADPPMNPYTTQQPPYPTAAKHQRWC